MTIACFEPCCQTFLLKYSYKTKPDSIPLIDSPRSNAKLQGNINNLPHVDPLTEEGSPTARIFYPLQSKRSRTRAALDRKPPRSRRIPESSTRFPHPPRKCGNRTAAPRPPRNL